MTGPGTCVWLTFPEPEPPGTSKVWNHAMPLALREDFEARILRDYQTSPIKREGLDAPLTLDTGGMAFMDTPFVTVQLKTYAVRCKHEHVPFIAAEIQGRLNTLDRMRIYGGVPCLTLYQTFWHIVLPCDDLQTILTELRPVIDESTANSAARFAALRAKKNPHILLPDG